MRDRLRALGVRAARPEVDAQRLGLFGISLGALVAFFLYLNRFFQPIQLLVQQYNTYQQGQASVAKLRQLLDTEPSVMESADAVELGNIRGAISFDHVYFGYDPAVPVLEDVKPAPIEAMDRAIADERRQLDSSGDIGPSRR